MTETAEQFLKRMMVWDHPPYDGPVFDFKGIEDFHEWCVELAIKKFRGKRNQAAPPVCCYVLQRPGGVSVLNTPWEGPEDKFKVQRMVRGMVSNPLMGGLIPWMATINEVWIASEAIAQGKSFKELRAQYGEVRHMPGREDRLMVITQSREGKHRVTRWVVKPKPNPADSIMLARDDFDSDSKDQFSGRHFNYFDPDVKEIDD